jgi:hypothetical protein
METEMSIANDCSSERVASDYAPIVDDAVGAYRRNLDELLLSVRLMGSVPRGEATMGVSDIDFVALTSMNSEADHRSMLEAESKRLTAKYSCVSRVDLEIEIKGRVTPVRDFIFRSDSICVWGDDTYIKTDTKMSNIALAKLVSPDFSKLLSGYRQRLKNPIQAEELGQLCRSVGKDVLRCFRRFLILKFALYKRSAVDIRDQLVSYFPQEIDTFDRLLGIHEQPIKKREDLLDVLRGAAESFKRMEMAAV